ncbi:MAG: hypothetical protein WCH62_04955 [Candidatus Omnitrophota bacterium]
MGTLASTVWLSGILLLLNSYFYGQSFALFAIARGIGASVLPIFVGWLITFTLRKECRATKWQQFNWALVWAIGISSFLGWNHLANFLH